MAKASFAPRLPPPAGPQFISRPPTDHLTHAFDAAGLIRCAGLDVHKKTVAACVRVRGTQHVRTFGTTATELLVLRTGSSRTRYHVANGEHGHGRRAGDVRRSLLVRITRAKRSMTSRGLTLDSLPDLEYKRVVSCKDSFHGTDVLAVSEHGAPGRPPEHPHALRPAPRGKRSTLIADIPFPAWKRRAKR